MTSWKTTLGGALAALGTFLWGAPVAMKAMEVAIDPAVVKWCVIAGLIASALGVFFIGLFGRDNNVTSEDVQRAAQERELKRNFDKVPVWLIAFAVLALGLSACQTVPRATVTLTGVVDAAMKDWAQASKAGHTTPALDAKVTAAHDQYRAACGVAAAAFEAYQANGDQAGTLAALKTLRATVDPLIELILPLVTAPQAEALKGTLARVNAP